MSDNNFYPYFRDKLFGKQIFNRSTNEPISRIVFFLVKSYAEHDRLLAGNNLYYATRDKKNFKNGKYLGVLTDEDRE